MEQELAEALPDFNPLALAVVDEGIGDDCRVVFIDDVVLGVGGGEDDGSTHGYPGAEEGGGGYFLVVDQSFVESVEGCIRDDLACDVVSFSVGGGFGGGRGREVARDQASKSSVPSVLRPARDWTMAASPRSQRTAVP